MQMGAETRLKTLMVETPQGTALPMIQMATVF